MFSLGELLAIVLDENYDTVDTSIPVNCHVLASTFYINVQEPKKPMKQHYLFELIQKKPIWSNLSFWERAISQFIQFDILQHKDMDKELKNVEEERNKTIQKKLNESV